MTMSIKPKRLLGSGKFECPLCGRLFADRGEAKKCAINCADKVDLSLTEQETKVLLISDLHCGSYAGLMPPEVKLTDTPRGAVLTHTSSNAQAMLYDAWCEMVDDMSDYKPDLVIVNGDIVDGMNQADGGVHTITNDMYAQADMAADLLSMIPCNCFLITIGSGYHSRTGRNGAPIEPYIADALTKAIQSKGRNPNVTFSSEAIVKLNGKRFHVTHTVGHTNNYQYRSTALMRDMTNMLLNWPTHKFGHVDAIIRGHVHFFINVRMADIEGIITPCWKLRDSFCTKIGLNSQPDIGYVTMDWKRGGDIKVNKRLFHLPDTACRTVDYDGE